MDTISPERSTFSDTRLARRLLESIAQADAGLLEEHSLDLGPASPADTHKPGNEAA